MVQDIKDLVEELKKSEKYKDFSSKHSEAYLTSAFYMAPVNEKPKWTLGFFDKEEHKLTSFVIDNGVKIFPSQQVMQKEKKEVKRLDLNSIKVTLEKAKEIVEQFQKEKYPYEGPDKMIIVLQVINDITVWNISYLTTGLKLLNIKVNAISGDVIEDSIENLLKTGSA
ncbi:MAG: PepSY domain-containing protein [archaeon]